MRQGLSIVLTVKPFCCLHRLHEEELNQLKVIKPSPSFIWIIIFDFNGKCVLRRIRLVYVLASLVILVLGCYFS